MSQWFLKIKYYIYTNTLPLPVNALNLDLVGSRGRKRGLRLLHFKMLQSQTYTFEGKKKKTDTPAHKTSFIQSLYLCQLPNKS